MSMISRAITKSVRARNNVNGEGGLSSKASSERAKKKKDKLGGSDGVFDGDQ